MERSGNKRISCSVMVGNSSNPFMSAIFYRIYTREVSTCHVVVPPRLDLSPDSGVQNTLSLHRGDGGLDVGLGHRSMLQ